MAKTKRVRKPKMTASEREKYDADMAKVKKATAVWNEIRAKRRIVARARDKANKVQKEVFKIQAEKADILKADPFRTRRNKGGV